MGFRVRILGFRNFLQGGFVTLSKETRQSLIDVNIAGGKKSFCIQHFVSASCPQTAPSSTLVELCWQLNVVLK